MAYDDAVRELSAVPLAQFVAERKRLSGELRAAGDRFGAQRLAKRARPPASAWVVNQLYWHARDAFDALLATGARLRRGELAANAEHRDTLATLRQRATAMLSDAGHGATEATLRRVAMTLSAIAATGFDPDLPGTLSEDRDPPGFEAAGIAPMIAEPAPPPTRAHTDDLARTKPAPEETEQAKQAERAKQAEQAEQAKQRELAKQREHARHRLEAALRTAHGDVEARERTAERLEQQLQDARAGVVKAREIVAELERELEAD